MFVKKFLSQPNIVGSVLIALLICAGIVYAFGFNGFNVQTATNGNVDAWLAQAGDGNCGGGDEDREEGEVGDEPCACYQNLVQTLHAHADCSCGNKVWRRPRKSGKKKDGGWFSLCNDLLKAYPCSKGKKGPSPCIGRNKHQTSGTGHCPCDPHPVNTSREIWSICDRSSKTKCNDGCWQGVKH